MANHPNAARAGWKDGWTSVDVIFRNPEKKKKKNIMTLIVLTKLEVRKVNPSWYQTQIQGHSRPKKGAASVWKANLLRILREMY